MPLAVAQPRFWASFLLFLSGATGLVYEVVWSKQLANLVGSTGQANVIVVATFMGGLALGAYLLGRRADVAPRPLALYGGLELAIGLYALVFPVFLGLAGRLYTSAVPSLPPEWRLFAKLLLASLTLLPPTLAMGGTVPALVRYFSEGLADMRGELARLYAVNSLGAALGCFVAGTVLLPAFGLLSSMRGAAIVNVLLGAVAMVLARRAPARQPATPPDTQVGEVVRSAGHEPVYPARAIRAAQVGLALTGFGTMVAEVAWIRVLTLVLGGSTYAFTLILSTFVLGIGLGSYWLSRRKSDGNSLRLFGKLQIALVVSVCVALPLYARLPYWFWRWGEVLQRSVSTWPLYQLMTFAMCALVLLLPTFWMGASFPCGARVATAQASQLGRQLGGAYLWNTIGTVLGSALGGLWLMPRLGLEGLFLLALLAHLAAAAFALLQPGEGLTHGRRWAPLALGLASLSAFMVSERGWGMQLAVAGTYRLVDKAPASYAAFREWVARDTKSLLHRDESVATVLVSDSASSGVRSMRINGKADASNDIDMETQVLSGHLGVLLHPRDVKRVLIVGMGSGVTAGAVLAHPVEHVDVVEISPAVIEGARFFAKDNAQALDDKRLHVHLEDAKNFLQLAGTYDLIISEPSNPWVAGIANLFSRDYFQEATAHLTPDGLMVQWIHAYETSESLVKLVMRTVRDTFPYVTTWVGGADLVMVAGRQPYAPDVEAIRRRLDTPSARQDLARLSIHDVATFLGRQVHSDAGHRAFAGTGEVNTDDLNILEYAAPVAFFVRKMADVPDERFRRGAAPLWIEEVQAGDAQLSAAQWSALHRGLSQSFPAESPLLRSISEKWHALEANEASARALARSAAAQGDTTFAFQVLSERMKSESISPDLANDYLLAFAQQLRTRHSALVRRDWSQEMKAAHQARTLVSGNEKAVGLYQRICELLGESPTSTLK